MSKSKNLGAYFRARTRKLKSGCWEWQGSTERRGYGRMGLGGKMCMAHRVAYEHFVGPIPKGSIVCHRCDNPSCCNPEHLFLGTQKDNVADMVRKGRAATGSRNGNARLSEEDVLRLRAGRNVRGFVAKVARELGISRSAAYRAACGTTWGHLTPPRS